MIIEGIKLAFIGMSTVLLFLSLMILLMQWVAHLTRGAAQRELDSIKLEKLLKARSRQKTTSSPANDSDEDIAAIAAAVATYEKERLSR